MRYIADELEKQIIQKGDDVGEFVNNAVREKLDREGKKEEGVRIGEKDKND